ncbi:MAG: hypothetical protein ACYDBB_20670 [Armatimonadota bacterium]
MVESWQGEVGKLTFGIEQEQFIFHEEGTPPRKRDIAALFDALMGCGFSPGVTIGSGELISVERATATGPLVVKNDYCTHILEFALPPMRHLDELVACYTEVSALINGLLRRVGMQIVPGGALEQVPAGTVVVPNPRKLIYYMRQVPRRPFSQSMFFAAMCATQVHLNILDDALYAQLPAYYSREYLPPLLYSQSPRCCGHRVHCTRPLMYRDGFVSAYWANAIPYPIPTTREEYGRLLAASEGFMRDYCFIAPTKHGTVEFRSGCSQPTIEEIVELLTLRIAVAVGVHAGFFRPRAGLRALCWDACRQGMVPGQVLEEDYRVLTRVAGELPDEYRAPLGNVLQRMAMRM